ncbi:MAG: energy transducer TonB [Bacteroidota bacterium]
MKPMYHCCCLLLSSWVAGFGTCTAQTLPQDSIAAEQESEDLIFSNPHALPRFYDPACEQLENYSEKKQCAEKAMFWYVYDNLEYPDHFYTEEGIQGIVVIGFTVDKNGTIHSVVIRRDIGEGYGTAALKVVENMPDWIPGTQRGKPVDINFNLPVRFKIEE